jgi:hypothetical protein
MHPFDRDMKRTIKNDRVFVVKKRDNLIDSLLDKCLI